MMTTHRGMITLLKSAILQQPLPLPKDFDLEKAMPLIRSHQVASLIYDGAACCGIPRNLPAMQELFRGYCKMLQVSERQMGELNRLYEAFDANGIDYMPLKGAIMKRLYPRPELRPMGDADILIRMEQYDRIRPLMQSLGFAEKQETDHELVWQSDSLYVELHKRLIPSYNKDFYAYYGSGWNLARQGSGNCCSMSPEDSWIYLFTHFAKHYRDGGIGLRHVMDLWVWRRTYPAMDEGYIKPILKKLHLDEFYGNILRLLDHWFENGSGDSVLEVITEFVFSSGSFGDAEMKALSLALRGGKHTVHRNGSRMTYLWQMAFPDVESLQGKYTVLKKAPWMLPAVWVVRPFYKLVYERKSVKQKMENLESLTKEKIALRQELLTYVGLDYHF